MGRWLIGVLGVGIFLLHTAGTGFERDEGRRELKLIFIRAQMNCEVEPAVLEVNNGQVEKLGELLPQDPDNHDPFVSYYNRDVEVLLLRKYDRKGYTISEIRDEELSDGCGKRTIYQLEK